MALTNPGTKLTSEEAARTWAAEVGAVWPRASKAPWWEIREELRREAGCWQTSPTLDRLAKQYRPIAGHHLHVALSDKTKVAYTPDAAKGEADRATVTTLAKYVQKHLGLPEWTAKAWGEQFTQENDENPLYFAFGADEIEKLYRTGPNSCMSNPTEFRTKEHPIRVYDGPDVAVAYLMTGAKITSRTVINLAGKGLIYGYSYGNTGMLNAKFEKLGFRYGNLNGARLRLAVDTNGYLCPYVDGVASGTANRKQGWLRLGNGDLRVQNASGVIERATEPCEACDKDFPPENMKTTYEDGFVCPTCETKHKYQRITIGGSGRTPVYALISGEDAKQTPDKKYTFAAADDDVAAAFGYRWIDRHEKFAPAADVVTAVGAYGHTSQELRADCISLEGVPPFHPEDPPKNVKRSKLTREWKVVVPRVRKTKAKEEAAV